MTKQPDFFHTSLHVNINEYSEYDYILIAGDASELTAF